ncbi:RNA polymerase sigma factor [Dyadobacter sp. CY347]|uniref:RNA polymerase sigma factor n=1 Tax=Dyadobacter sp. CY347 TaxID=2909336 RepID=UPI001F433830|nr:sigma-70 family RNA polymerase sigma factor [Dyadobacter sp. CY347]MCF2491607.1 sigma-70 family RNA polymerase sigma factor [Dyadobacter sp. CY347]
MKHVDNERHQEIWQETLAGNLDAFGDLFDLLAKELISYAYKVSMDRALAKDAVQDVFIYIWQHRDSLAKEVDVRFYLYSAVKRATVLQMRAFSLNEPISENSSENPDDSPEAIWVKDETESLRKQRVEKSLKSLSEREREVISLKYFSNLKIREIAVVLKIKEQTVANTLQIALSKLRKHFIYLLWYLICQLP